MDISHRIFRIDSTIGYILFKQMWRIQISNNNLVITQKSKDFFSIFLSLKSICISQKIFAMIAIIQIFATSKIYLYYKTDQILVDF